MATGLYTTLLGHMHQQATVIVHDKHSHKDSVFDHSMSVIPLSYHITNDHQLAEQII